MMAWLLWLAAALAAAGYAVVLFGAGDLGTGMAAGLAFLYASFRAFLAHPYWNVMPGGGSYQSDDPPDPEARRWMRVWAVALAICVGLVVLLLPGQQPWERLAYGGLAVLFGGAFVWKVRGEFLRVQAEEEAARSAKRPPPAKSLKRP